MAVSLYFGLPGSGKTTIMTSIAVKAVRRGSLYKNVYCNVHIAVPGVTYIDNDCIGKYNLENCLLLIDEATLFADSRNFKEFDKSKLSFFLQHRHYKCDIYLFTQQWDGVDRKIRVITDRVYYVYKGMLGAFFSCYYRIPYGIIIPSKRDTGEKLGDIIQGYSKPPLLYRLFCTKRVFRPSYYRFFDSFERPELPPLPEKYTVYVRPRKKQKPSESTKMASTDATCSPMSRDNASKRNSDGEDHRREVLDIDQLFVSFDE